MTKTDEPIETVTQFCICSEEFCFCSNTVEMPMGIAAYGGTWQCSDCMRGNHVWSPNERRQHEVVHPGPDAGSDRPRNRFLRWLDVLRDRLT